MTACVPPDAPPPAGSNPPCPSTRRLAGGAPVLCRVPPAVPKRTGRTRDAGPWVTGRARHPRSRCTVGHPGPRSPSVHNPLGGPISGVPDQLRDRPGKPRAVDLRHQRHRKRPVDVRRTHAQRAGHQPDRPPENLGDRRRLPLGLARAAELVQRGHQVREVRRRPRNRRRRLPVPLVGQRLASRLDRPRITVSGLFISWAAPAVISPRRAIDWASVSLACTAARARLESARLSARPVG